MKDIQQAFKIIMDDHSIGYEPGMTNDVSYVC
jgi:hypothetical protein